MSGTCMFRCLWRCVNHKKHRPGKELGLSEIMHPPPPRLHLSVVQQPRRISVFKHSSYLSTLFWPYRQQHKFRTRKSLGSAKPFAPCRKMWHHFFPIAYRFVQSLASLSNPARSSLNCSAILPSTASSGFGSVVFSVSHHHAHHPFLAVSPLPLSPQFQRRNVPLSNCRANSSTATIFVLGFHSLSRSMPRHIAPLFGGVSFEMLGW